MSYFSSSIITSFKDSSIQKNCGSYSIFNIQEYEVFHIFGMAIIMFGNQHRSHIIFNYYRKIVLFFKFLSQFQLSPLEVRRNYYCTFFPVNNSMSCKTYSNYRFHIIFTESLCQLFIQQLKNLFLSLKCKFPFSYPYYFSIQITFNNVYKSCSQINTYYLFIVFVNCQCHSRTATC